MFSSLGLYNHIVTWLDNKLLNMVLEGNKAAEDVHYSHRNTFRDAWEKTWLVREDKKRSDWLFETLLQSKGTPYLK